MNNNDYREIRNKHLKTLEDNELLDIIEFIRDREDYTASLELDLDVANAVIDGSWPTADKIIELRRNKK